MEGTMAVITIFAGTFAPQNWAFCQGQLQSIDENSALYALLGTTYGGDGQQTFGLPDLRGRIPIGTGQAPGGSNYVLGQQGGSYSVTLNSNQLASHTHGATATVPASSASATTNSPNGNAPATTATNFYAPVNNNEHLGGVTASLQPAGGSAPTNLGMPSLGLNYVICLFGIFPSRN